VRVRLVPVAAFVVAVVAVAAPALRQPSADSYPLSTYPMFSDNQGRSAAVDVAVGVRADGTREALSPQLVTGTPEIVLAVATVSDAVHEGRAEVLCADVAARVGRSSRAAVAEVEIATETYDAPGYFAGDRAPLARTVHARCPVLHS
jgi:hypothetical protein